MTVRILCSRMNDLASCMKLRLNLQWKPNMEIEKSQRCSRLAVRRPRFKTSITKILPNWFLSIKRDCSETQGRDEQILLKSGERWMLERSGLPRLV